MMNTKNENDNPLLAQFLERLLREQQKQTACLDHLANSAENVMLTLAMVSQVIADTSDKNINSAFRDAVRACIEDTQKSSARFAVAMQELS